MAASDRNSDDSTQSRFANPDGIPTIGESSPEAAELNTRRIGHFEIISLLGQGAFGAVYHAKDPLLEREVAIKVPHASRIATPELRQRFLREARAAAGLRHPNICPVYEIGEENDAPYIVMAFIKGQELSAVLKRRGHFTDRKAAILVRRIALGLEFAHQQGIVHRDLKPDNIMIDRERKEPVIMDFGLARRDSGDESKLTQEGQLMGTPVYMPPEQARGDIAQIGPASDIYSLGIILYELLAGCRPYGGSLAEVLSKVLTADAAPPSSHRPDISTQLEAICLKAIEHDVENRYASMLELADDLAEFLKTDGESSTAETKELGSFRTSAGSEDSSAHSETVLIRPSFRGSVIPVDRWPYRIFPALSRGKFGVLGIAAILLVVLTLFEFGFDSSNRVRTEIPEPPDARPALIRRFTGAGTPLAGVQLSPDNQWIAARTNVGPVLVWHRDHEGLKMVDADRRLVRLHAFGADSRSLIVHSLSSVIELSISEGSEKVLASYPRSRVTPSTFSISRSGLVFVSRRLRDRQIKNKLVIEAWLDSKNDRSIGVLPPAYVSRWGVLPESSVFVAVERENGEVYFWDFQGKLVEQGSRTLLPAEHLTIAGRHGTPVINLAWSLDERVVATADVNGDVILWDVHNGTALRRLTTHPSTVHSLALSPDGRFVLTGCGDVSKEATHPDELSDDYDIRLWDVETGSLITTVGSHKCTVTGLSFGSQIDEAVSCSNDNTVCLWKLPVAGPPGQ